MAKTERIIFRVTPEERAEGKDAIRASGEAWKGESYFVHAAYLTWARRVLADQLAATVRAKEDRARSRRVNRASFKRLRGAP